MSNEVVDQAAIEERLRKQAEDMAKRIGQGGNDKIKLLKKKAFKLPNGVESEPGTPLAVVILDFVAFNVYYDRPFVEKSEEPVPPACFALGAVKPIELVPSASSPVKQDAACKDCWANKFKSAPNNRGKACGNHYRLAVVEATADPEAPIYLLQTPPGSGQYFEKYTNGLLMDKKAPIQVVTEIWFHPDSDYQDLRFGNPKPNVNLGIHFPRQAGATKRLLLEPDVSAYTPPPAPKGPAKK